MVGIHLRQKLITTVPYVIKFRLRLPFRFLRRFIGSLNKKKPLLICIDYHLLIRDVPITCFMGNGLVPFRFIWGLKLNS